MDAKFDARLQELKNDLMEFSRGLQDELLRGFEVFAKASEARLRRLENGHLTLSADDAAMNERLARVESRLLEIEKKLLRAPAA